MKRVIVTLSVFLLLSIPLPVLSGCGGTRKVTGSEPSSAAMDASAPTGTETEQEILEDYTDPDQKAAVLASVRYAADSNSGSRFDVSDACTVKGWSRVTVEQTGVPAEQAVTFTLFLKKADSGKWEVVESGNDLKPEQVPGAPAELFN